MEKQLISQVECTLLWSIFTHGLLSEPCNGFQSGRAKKYNNFPKNVAHHGWATRKF